MSKSIVIEFGDRASPGFIDFVQQRIAALQPGEDSIARFTATLVDGPVYYGEALTARMVPGSGYLKDQGFR